MYIGYGSDLFEVDPTGTLPQVGVVTESTLAVVGVQRSALTCFTCVSRSFCTHRNLVQKYLSTPQNEDSVRLLPNGLLNIWDQLSFMKSNRGTNQSTSIVKCVSSDPIPHVPIEDEPLQLTAAIPSESACPTCKQSLYPEKNRSYAGLYPMLTMSNVVPVKGMYVHTV